MAGEIQRWNAYRVETYLMQSKFLVGLVYVFFVARGGKMCALSRAVAFGKLESVK